MISIYFIFITCFYIRDLIVIYGLMENYQNSGFHPF